jgi:hypothetical protein
LNVKISCDDGDECTIDRCHCDDGCQHFPVSADENANCAEWKPEECSNDAACEDENPCTENSCVSGKCHTVATDCDDDDLCTVDSCHKERGCIHTLIDGPSCYDSGHSIDLLGDHSLNGRNKVLNDKANLIEGENTDIHERPKITETSLSVGAIIGIVIGSVVAVGLLGLIILLLKPKAKNPEDYQKM